MLDAMRRQILDALWPLGLSSRMSVYTILDGARDSRIYGAVEGCYQEKHCLYSGDLPWQLQRTAPYLVKLDRDDRFTAYLLDNGWGGSWGVWLRTETSSQQLRKHLRGFLRVKDEAGRRLIFRYYDPRVLRIYFPTCRPSELETFFGPVTAYLAEGERPSEIIEFVRTTDTLISRHIPLDVAPQR
jgi:hypothetical protein